MSFKTSTIALLALAFFVLNADQSIAADGHKNHAHQAKKDKHGAQGDTIELTGEIIDITCYLSHPSTSRGEDHAQCAEDCLNRGLPSGLLVGDQLYLLLAGNHKSANDQVSEFAGQNARVKGVLKEMNGLKTLFVSEVHSSK